MNWEYSAYFEASPAAVFAVLADLDLIPRWEDGVIGLQPVSALPIRLGSTFLETRTTLGQRMEILLQVTAYEKDRVFGVEAIGGPVEFSGVRYLHPKGSGTSVFETGSARIPRMMELLGPLLPRLIARANDASYGRIRELLRTMV